MLRVPCVVLLSIEYINLLVVRAIAIVPAIVLDGYGLPSKVSGLFVSVLCALDTYAFVAYLDRVGVGVDGDVDGDVGVVLRVDSAVDAFVGVAVLFGAVAAKT